MPTFPASSIAPPKATAGATFAANAALKARFYAHLANRPVIAHGPVVVDHPTLAEVRTGQVAPAACEQFQARLPELIAACRAAWIAGSSREAPRPPTIAQKMMTAVRLWVTVMASAPIA